MRCCTGIIAKPDESLKKSASVFRVSNPTHVEQRKTPVSAVAPRAGRLTAPLVGCQKSLRSAAMAAQHLST